MEIDLLNTSSDKRRILKDYDTLVTYITCHLKENTSVIDPIFILKVASVNDDVLRVFNYVYCPYLHRYYFVNDIKYCAGGILEIHCHVDVLMSYADKIRTHGAFVERAEKKLFQNAKNGVDKNGIFFDTEYPIRTDSYIWTNDKLEFGSVANSQSYYLTVNGGILDNQ